MYNNEKAVDIYTKLELLQISDYEWTGQISNCWEPTITKRMINDDSLTIRID